GSIRSTAPADGGRGDDLSSEAQPVIRHASRSVHHSGCVSYLSRFMITYLALVSPPVAPAVDVFARSLAEIGRADDDDLEALRPGLVASPRTGRDAHRVPLLELDDLVVELHPPAPAQDHVHLLLLLVRVAVRKAIAGRDALVAKAGLLDLERLGRQAELKVRRAVKLGPEVLNVLLEVLERERHGRNPMRAWLRSPLCASSAFCAEDARIDLAC